MRFKNIRNNAHTRLVNQVINHEYITTVEEKLLHRLGHDTDVAVVVNMKGQTVATINLNSDSFVQDLKGIKHD